MVLQIAKEMGMRQTDIKRIVQMTLDGIIDVLASEERLELRNFGVFEVRTRKPRKARNPRTGAEVMVAERKVVTFKPGKQMEEQVCGKPATSEQPTKAKGKKAGATIAPDAPTAQATEAQRATAGEHDTVRPGAAQTPKKPVREAEPAAVTS